jgi:hypothetical protein
VRLLSEDKTEKMGETGETIRMQLSAMLIQTAEQFIPVHFAKEKIAELNCTRLRRHSHLKNRRNSICRQHALFFVFCFKKMRHVFVVHFILWLILGWFLSSACKRDTFSKRLWG